MDTDALRWLQQVADGTTVTEVSELETVTQSGVSRALARLEAQIGTPLLRRSGRTLRMTHAGAVFKPHLDALLHHLDDGIAAVNQLIDPDTGTVALAWAPGSSPTWPAASAPPTRASASSSPRSATSRTRRPSTAGTPTWNSARGGRGTRRTRTCTPG
jgi:DNA-binding transcriptional LysR family regulator